MQVANRSHARTPHFYSARRHVAQQSLFPDLIERTRSVALLEEEKCEEGPCIVGAFYFYIKMRLIVLILTVFFDSVYLSEMTGIDEKDAGKLENDGNAVLLVPLAR